MKLVTLLAVLALLIAAPCQAAEAATPAAPGARTSLKVTLPLFGKPSAEKRNIAKRKQTLRRRKHLYSF